VTLPTNQAIELLSSAYRRYGKKLGPAALKQYADIVKTYYDHEPQTDEQKAFIKDYLQTIARMEAEKVELAEGELNKELNRLPQASTSTVKLNELVVKPELFDGERPKPRRWLQEYNEAILANGWSDLIAVKYLPTFLIKSAKDWYFTEIRPFITPNTKWLEVAEAFSRNYLGESDYEQLSQAVDNARQRPGESVSNFIPRFRRLILLLTPDLTEKEQLRQLKSRLRPEYKPLVALQD